MARSTSGWITLHLFDLELNLLIFSILTSPYCSKIELEFVVALLNFLVAPLSFVFQLHFKDVQ